MYTDIITVDSTTKDQLYTRTKMYLTNLYKSANDVIQMDDKEGGVIIAKGLFKVNASNGLTSSDMPVLHTFRIYIKDGKIKYEVTDLILKYYDKTSGYVDYPIEQYKPISKKLRRDISQKSHDNIVAIIEGIAQGCC